MKIDLDELAEVFGKYRGNRKYVRYPKDFWDRAAQACNHETIAKVASSLNVNVETLRGHCNDRKKEKNAFVPLNVIPSTGIQIRILGPAPITIDFQEPTEELAKLILFLQRGASSC